MKRTISEILFSIYSSLVFTLVYTAQFTLESYWLLILFVIFFVIFFLVSKPLFGLVGKVYIRPQTTEKKTERIMVIAAFAIALLYLGLWYYYYYPGWLTGDSFWQMSQATSGVYSDWHPVLQTLLTFTFPLAVTNGWIGSIVLFQIVEFSVVLAYMVKTLLRYGNIRFTAIAYSLVLLNPVTATIIKQPWKDVSLAMFATLMSCYALNISQNKEWIRKPANLLAVAVVTAVTSIVRHNAILFTIPMAICIIHYINSTKMKILFPILAFSVFFIIKGPIYDSLNVERPGNRVTETVGLPMIVIGEAVKESPELLDDEVLSFAYSIASPETWQDYYYSGDFNTIKFDGDINTVAIEQAGTVNVLKVMFSCIIESPRYSLKGLIDGTKMVYALTGDISWASDFIPPKILNPILSTPLKYIVLYIGLGNFALILLSLQRKNGWFSLPLLFHNFGTMLLLTGYDFRFFYITYPVSWLIIFSLLVVPRRVVCEE